MIQTPNEHSYVNHDLDTILGQIAGAKYGSDVRQAIYDGVGQAWENSAQSAADAAQSAEDAISVAGNAVTIANGAVTTANTAAGSASNAVTAAQNAQQAAETAQDAAEQAQAAAEKASEDAAEVIGGVEFGIDSVMSADSGEPPSATVSRVGNRYGLSFRLVPGDPSREAANTIRLDDDQPLNIPTIRDVLNILQGGSEWSGTNFTQKAEAVHTHTKNQITDLTDAILDLGNGQQIVDGVQYNLTNTSLPSAYPDGMSVISDLTASGTNWPFTDGMIVTIKTGPDTAIQIGERKDWGYAGTDLPQDSLVQLNPMPTVTGFPYIYVRYYAKHYSCDEETREGFWPSIYYSYSWEQNGTSWSDWTKVVTSDIFKVVTGTATATIGASSAAGTSAVSVNVSMKPYNTNTTLVAIRSINFSASNAFLSVDHYSISGNSVVVYVRNFGTGSVSMTVTVSALYLFK